MTTQTAASTTSFIESNRVRSATNTYLHTGMVSHRGVPISFAMTADGEIFYSVLDLSTTQEGASEDAANDKNFWSPLDLSSANPSRLEFPEELSRVGYGVVPNRQIAKYNNRNEKVVHEYSDDGAPLDLHGQPLTAAAIRDQTDRHLSSTARLGAAQPFQALSDGKYVYVFRQSIAADHPNNQQPPIVDNSLLVDRFILSGTVLKLSREIRYQRSRHKTEPESRKDTLSGVDMDGNPFYEPTRELSFAGNLSDGGFSVLLLPGADPEEQRWQIFTSNATTQKINSFNIRFDDSIVVDTSDSKLFVDDFIAQFELDTSLIGDVQDQIRAGLSDDEVAATLLGRSPYSTKNIPADALSELVYTLRTGAIKDDFVPTSASMWPLIEYDQSGTVKSEYRRNGVLIDDYAFRGQSQELRPYSAPYTATNGLSSCYYYQQEMGGDNKPIKNKACVMLALGLEDSEANKYIGILNFSVAASGRLSRLTTDAIDMPDINVQALDETPYKDLAAINEVAWQPPQKMHLIDIDPNGLSTSGGVLKFAYTSAAFASQYSDAVEAYDPYVFDDSLGRVNLYFRGKNENFFVLYFNPQGAKSVRVTHDSQPASPPMALAPRLDRDMTIDVSTDVEGNSCTMSMTSAGETVEQWRRLPRSLSHVAAILNGNGELPLGSLEPLGDAANPLLAYQRPSSGSGTLHLRTTTDNNLMFKDNALAASIADGASHTIPLAGLSSYLASNTELRIAQKSFSLAAGQDVVVRADRFHKPYLSGIVTDPEDIEKLWGHLEARELIQEDAADATRAALRRASLTGTATSLDAVLQDQGIRGLTLQLLQVGSEGDRKARLARLKQSLIALLLDVAKVRILTFAVVDRNAQQVDALEAGLPVSTVYDHAANFDCHPDRLGGTSASEWEHARSYLFNARVEYGEAVDATTEIDAAFDYRYSINNTIGQWEDWEASLALEFSPGSATQGGRLSTADRDKLRQLRPTEKGLSVEAWIKPSSRLNDPGSIVYFKDGARHYSLGIEKDAADPGRFKGVATFGDKRYRTRGSYAFLSDGREYWRHLAFTHRKHWGYRLNPGSRITCGNDSSLSLDGEFSIEVLARIDAAGTLLKREGEYSLQINGRNELVFDWGGTNYLEEWVGMPSAPTRSRPAPLTRLNGFYKITLIRSRRKPLTAPTPAEYPITGGSQDGASGSGPKWYEGKSGDELTRGMAEKQDQMENSMDLSRSNLLGSVSGPDGGSEDLGSDFYHTLIITDGGGSSAKWTTSEPVEVARIESHGDLFLGGDGFAGVLAAARIWNRALSEREAEALPMPDNETALLSHWRISEGKGAYLYDNAGENHGVAADASGWTDSPQPNLPGQFLFYVDGSAAAAEAPTNYSASGSDQLSVGGVKTGGGATEHFDGTLEEIRIWNLPRSAEQISDNAFGRLKGEWEQLLANYTFDTPMAGDVVMDASTTTAQLVAENPSRVEEVLSTAPVATEIPQIRSALTGVVTDYNGTIRSRPAVVEYGDVQQNDDGTLNGILKRCYSFIDDAGAWNRVTGYKVGNLVSQWYGQAQFSPQVVGYLEGSPPVPGENFPIGKEADVDTYAYKLDNSVTFKQAEEVSYNYSTSKEAGWNVAVESEMQSGASTEILTAPLGFGLSIEVKAALAAASKWETSGSRSQSYERGVSVNTDRALSASLAGYDNGMSGAARYYRLGNTGYALVKSKTADIYLLRLAHNNALVSIFWQPNPDIPEDVNILPFPIDPLYTKQGTLDGKLGDGTDDHYPQAHGAYGQYSYFKPRQAYQLKKRIERERLELQHYYEDSFDVAKTGAHFTAAAAVTGVAQLAAFYPAVGTAITSAFNQIAGQLATQVGYNNTELKDDLSKMGSQRNLVNTYVWTVEGGFYAESTEVADTQQETYANTTSLALGGGVGVAWELAAGGGFEQKTLFSSGSSFSLTKSRTRESASSFGLDVSVDIPTSPRYKYGGVDGRSLEKGLIGPGTVDAYRFMSFYLEPKGQNFKDLFTQVIDPKWLEESPDPNAQALRQARGDVARARPCWRIMHRVTYVSRILPEFQPEAPPSLEKSMRASGIESNYMLIKRFEPYVATLSDPSAFFAKIEEIVDTQMTDLKPYKRQIKRYLALYFNLEQA